MALSCFFWIWGFLVAVRISVWGIYPAVSGFRGLGLGFRTFGFMGLVFGILVSYALNFGVQGLAFRVEATRVDGKPSFPNMHPDAQTLELEKRLQESAGQALGAVCNAP